MIRAAWPAAHTRLLALRLSPGEDLRDALVSAFDAEPETAGFVVACVGSLRVANLRYAGRVEASVIESPLEIVSLSGTLSGEGPHLHAALSDEHGGMVGGHVLPGCLVRTTAEVVLGLTEAVAFRREVDPDTTYPELAFAPSDR